MKTGEHLKNPFRVGTIRWRVYGQLLKFRPVKVKRKDNHVIRFLRMRYGLKIDSLGGGRFILSSGPIKKVRKLTGFKTPVDRAVFDRRVEDLIQEPEVQERASMVIITILQVLTLLGQFILAIAYIVK